MVLTYRSAKRLAPAMCLICLVAPWPAGLNQLRGTSETLDTKAGVYVISPAGKLLTFIPIPEDLITNNAFGGADMKTLYVTAGETLYKIRTEIAGLPR